MLSTRPPSTPTAAHARYKKNICYSVVERQLLLYQELAHVALTSENKLRSASRVYEVHKNVFRYLLLAIFV